MAQPEPASWGNNWKVEADNQGFWSQQGFEVFLKNLPIYRPGLSPYIRGLEIGMAHGYWVPGPFTFLGPLRQSPVGTEVGFICGALLMSIVVAAAKAYGFASF